MLLVARFLVILGALSAIYWFIGVTTESRALPAAVQPCSTVVVSWEPATPTQGALFRVRLRGVGTATSVTGFVAGEPLHFSAAGDSIRESLAAAPIDRPDSLNLVLRCTGDGISDSIARRIPTATGNYPIERLRVAPAFGRPPDSATAARIARESQRAVEVAMNAHGTPRLWREPFTHPRESRITSGFGGGREYNGQITSRHMGTDFAGATGAPVQAANRGVVRIVDSFFYGGNVVYIDHGAGLSSAYLHLSQQLVTSGDTVQRNQVIGRVGATGRVTGPHLHFIVRYGAVTVDPISLFAIAGDSSGTRK
jgi:murein DD-endopeptidase MepM/ murein hydrolase activator NlpD